MQHISTLNAKVKVELTAKLYSIRDIPVNAWQKNKLLITQASGNSAFFCLYLYLQSTFTYFHYHFVKFLLLVLALSRHFEVFCSRKTIMKNLKTNFKYDLSQNMNSKYCFVINQWRIIFTSSNKRIFSQLRQDSTFIFFFFFLCENSYIKESNF